MFSVTRMSDKLYAMKTVDRLDDLATDDTEFERTQTLIDQGTPVIFCEDLEDLDGLFPGETVEIIEPE